MANEEILELRYGVRRLETRCDALERRVTSLEGTKAAERTAVHATPTRVEVTPPPVIRPVVDRPQAEAAPEPQPFVRPTFQIPSAPAPQAAPPATMRPIDRPVAPRRTAAEAEYRLGAVVLPRIGAGLVLLAIGTFVSMAVSRGWIDQWGQFWLAVTACLAFVGVGVWKRNEQEEFGQLLVGIGSCGLYLAFTAGHVFLNRYSGETLVGLFLGLSLANLAYSYATSSRSFLAIGLIGGLTAAVMPMRDDHLTLNAILHFAIVVPSALIVIKNRWSASAMWLWLFASAALVPAMFHAGDWQGRTAMLYCTALICAATYSFSGEGRADPQGVFAPAALYLAAAVGLFWIEGGMPGALHVCLLAAASCLLGLGFGTQAKAGIRLLWAGPVIAFTLAPWGFANVQAPFLFLSLSIVCWLASVRIAAKPSVVLGWVVFLLAVFAYLLCLPTLEDLAGSTGSGWATEGALLAFTICAAVIGAWALNRIQGAPGWIALGASLLAIPVFTRLAYVALGLSPASIGLYPSLLIGWMIFSFVVNVVAARSKWVQPMAASWLTLVLGLLFYMPLASMRPLGEGLDALLIVGLIVTTLGTTFVTRGFWKTGEGEALSLLCAFMVLPFFSRLCWVVSTPTGMPGLAALIVAWIIYSLLLGGLTAWKGWKSMCGMSWLVLLTAMATYVPLTQQTALSEAAEVALILALIGVAAACTCITRLLDDARPVEALVNAAACLVLPLLSRLAFVVLAPAGLEVQSTLAIGWMSYSVLGCAIALKLRWNGTAALAAGVSILAGCAYFGQIAEQAPAFGTDVALALALSANLAFAAFTVSRRGALGMGLQALVTTTGFVLLPVFTRLSWLCLTHWGVDGAAATILGWLLFSLAASAIAVKTKWPAPTLLSWLCVVMSLGLYGAEVFSTGFGRGTECVLLVSMLGAVLGATLAAGRRTEDRGPVTCLAAGVCWALFSRLAVLVLTSRLFGMPTDGGITLSWVLYAATLMVLGFSYHAKLLRYWGFAVFGATLCKVAAVDMAALDPAIRVGVLMLFGLAMLGAGYWYVRNKERLDA